MSECVVRMEMPKKCQGCPVEIYGCCGITNKNIMLWNGSFPDERPSDCPIICSLPDKHGRLVDKDEMLKKIENYHRYMTIGRESNPRCIIEDSPTIVPATEGGNHERLD